MSTKEELISIIKEVAYFDKSLLERNLNIIEYEKAWEKLKKEVDKYGGKRE